MQSHYVTILCHEVFGDVWNGDPTSLLGFNHLCVSHTRWFLIPFPGFMGSARSVNKGNPFLSNMLTFQNRLIDLGSVWYGKFTCRENSILAHIFSLLLS